MGPAAIALLVSLACSASGPTPPATSVPAAPPSAVAGAVPSVSPLASPSLVPGVPSPSVAALATQAGLQPVRLAIPNKGTDFLYLLVGKDLGIYQKYGLDMQIMQISPPVSVAGLQAGDIDFTGLTGSIERGAIQGLPIRVMLLALGYTDFVLVGDTSVSSVADLRGGVIAADQPGSTDYDVTQELMRQNGLQPSDYTTIPLPDDSTRLAALGREAQGAEVEMSNAVSFLDQGYPLLTTAANVRFPNTGLGVAQSTLKNRRDFARAVAQATLEAIQTTQNDRDQALQVMEQELNVSPDHAASIYDELRAGWLTTGIPSQDTINTELANDQRDMQLSTTPTADQVYDFSVLQEIQGSQPGS